MLQRGGLSGGATSADSKKIYPIDISNTTADSAVYVICTTAVLERCYFYFNEAEGLKMLWNFLSHLSVSSILKTLWIDFCEYGKDNSHLDFEGGSPEIGNSPQPMQDIYF